MLHSGRPRQFPEQNIATESKPASRSICEKCRTLDSHCERKQKQVNKEVRIFQSHSSVYFNRFVDLTYFGHVFTPEAFTVFKTQCKVEIYWLIFFVFLISLNFPMFFFVEFQAQCSKSFEIS